MNVWRTPQPIKGKIGMVNPKHEANNRFKTSNNSIWQRDHMYRTSSNDMSMVKKSIGVKAYAIPGY